MYGILPNHKFKPNVGKYLGKFYTRIYMCVWSYFNYTILIKQQKHTVFLFLFDIFQYFLPVYPNDMDAPFDSRFVCWISQVTRINRMSAGKLPPQHLQVGHGWETHPRYGQLHIDTRMSQEDWHVFFSIPFLRPWWFLKNHGCYQTLCHRKTKHNNRFFSRTSCEFWSFCPFVGYGHVPNTLYLQIDNSLPNLPFFNETCDLHVAYQS